MSKKLSDRQIPDLSTLGKRLAQARRELGVREGWDISPPDMAGRLGVASATYWRWERDERRPNGAALLALAYALGVEADYLKGEGITPSAGGVPIDDVIETPAKKRAKGR